MNRSSTARTLRPAGSEATSAPRPAIGEDPREPVAAHGRGKVADVWLGTQLRALRKAKSLSLAQVWAGPPPPMAVGTHILKKPASADAMRTSRMMS